MSYRPHRRQIAGTRTVGIQTLLWLAAALAGALLCRPAAAATIDFDVDGPGALPLVVSVNQWDFSPGNVLAVGGVQAITDYVSSGGQINKPFEVLYQAQMVSAQQSDGGLVATWGPSFEITAVAKVMLKIDSVVGNMVFLKHVPSSTSFFELWYGEGPTNNLNNLAGTGFNDGTLIASGKIVDAPTIWFFDTGATDTFDKFGANQYPGVTTGVGAGTAELLADLRFLHPDFFPNHEQIGVYLTTDLKTPFRNVDPSQQFSDTPGGVNPSGVTPSIGAINGVSGPDFQFEGDARGILLPEPTGLAMLITCVTLMRSRRRRPIER